MDPLSNFNGSDEKIHITSLSAFLRFCPILKVGAEVSLYSYQALAEYERHMYGITIENAKLDIVINCGLTTRASMTSMLQICLINFES